MARFRIFRIKENPLQQFRWSPHLNGTSRVKPRDYEQTGEIDSVNEYSAWSELRQSSQPLRVGDILEDPSGRILICKYVGFEPAEWVLPELKTGLESVPPAAGPPSSPPPAEATASGAET